MAQAPLIPFDYLERQKRRAAVQTEIDDPIAKAMGVIRDEQVRSIIHQSPGPDQTAKVTIAARQTGEAPALIEDRLPDIERAQQANRMTAVLGKYPAFTRFAQTNPRAVAAAADDHKALGILGDAWDFLKSAGTRLEAGSYLGGAGIRQLTDPIAEAGGFINALVQAPLQTILDANGINKGYDPFEANRKFVADNAKGRAQMRTEAERLRQTARGGSWLADTSLQAFESLPLTFAAMLTKNPTIATAIPASSVAGNAYNDAKLKGLRAPEAIRYAVTQGATEYITEKGAAFNLIADIANKTPFGKTLLKQLATEIPGEQIATVVQDFTEWATLNPEKPFSSYVAERPEAALATLIQTSVGTSVQTAAVKATEATVDAAAKVAGRVVQAREAKQTESFLDRVERAAAESKLRGRDPEAFAELVEQTANDSGVGQVFIPAEAIRAFQQSDSYDQFDDPFADYQAQIDEAFEVGGDVVLPAGFALGTLPGTPAWAAVKSDMRLAPGGMSAREADDLSSQLDDIMGELTDQAYQRDADQQGERDARGQIVERVSAMLQNAGFTPANARMQAELIAQRESSRASRMGRELTGNEFGTEVVSVLPPALAEIQKADGLDLVVNALRKGKPATVQRGKSLLEWIAARGGVEDVGGDIASMGADRWHMLDKPVKGVIGKGKKKGQAFTATVIPGRRKLIKPNNAAQGSIIGGEFNPNTLENTLNAAISEGFFPELLAQRETATEYSDLIDTGVLLAAIGDELAGRSTYADEPVTDNVRAAAAELEQMLADRGLNASELTDAEIRAAVGQMEQEGSGGVIYDQLPDSIDIDGVARPTRNSEGMPLTGSEEGLRAFWKWFGDSAVVDEEGRPLVVYHGTGDQFEAFDVAKIGSNATALGYGFYFAVNKDVARGYESDGGTILPVYLAIEKPVGSDAKRLTGPKLKALVRAAVEAEIAAYPDEIPDYKDGFLSNVVDTYSTSYKDAVDEFARILAENDTAVDQLAELANVMGSKKQAFDAATRSGIDGIFVKDFQDGDGPVWIATSPTQIKSINNRGSFDPADARILYQEFNEGPRGRILMDGARPFRIELFQERNLSTLLHELSHQWLEELRADATTKEAPVASYRRIARLVQASAPKVQNGFVRLWRGERVGDSGKGLNYTNDLAGIALPFREGYGGELVYIDVPAEDAASYEMTGAVAPGAEFHVPAGIAAKARAVPVPIDPQSQVKADWQAVTEWFAANGNPIVDGVIPVEAHEMWARGGERYLMEGKAPSPALTGLFETFRGWLLSIYKTVQALRAPITPEIREVFDRLLATDEEIAAMAEMQALQPMFKDAAAIGITGQEFEAYKAQAQAARDEANSTLLVKTMAAIRRRETKKFRDERKAVMADEAERLNDEPLLKSIRLMQATPIDQEWLVDRMGLDVLSLLPKRVPPLWRERGVNPDSLAELAGFGSGQQMIEVLIGAERQHRQAREGGDQRTMRARMIENAVDAEMTLRYGDDPLNDGSIEQEAIAAVNGELQGELLASEVRLLSRRTGQRPTPYKIARQWARNRVRTGLVSVEASPGAIQRHARNVAKAGRDAEKAMLAGKMDEALRFKQQQMLSSALLAEAKEASDEVNAAVKRMGKIAKRATMKSVDQDYLEQAHALLEAVDLKERTQKSENRKKSFQDWAAAREAEGFEVVVPPSFEATLGKTNWSRLPVETLLGLDEAVAQVMHLGRFKQSLLDRQDQREWDEIFQEAENAGGNIDGPPPKDMTDPGWWGALKGRILGADAALLKMETVFDWLDGGDSNGVFNRIVFRPIADAQSREQDMQKDYMGRIKALFEAVPAEVGARWQDKMELPFVDPLTGMPMRMNRHKVIAMALNVGNEGNLQRLSDGYRINAGALTDYLNATLTAEEWQFVQGVWDTIDTLWPEIARIEREVNGVAPDKVDAREVVTPFGPLRGGYYPAVYDTTRDYKAEENKGRESDLFEGAYTRATTRASSTKERAEAVKRPILLDLGVINRHLGEVIHDITHREAVIRANRFLTNERVMRTIDAALGPEIRKQLRPWLKFVANSWAIERAGNEGFGKFIGQLRANATVVGMGLRATTMVTQIAGYSNSVEVVGETAMAKALAQFTRNPAEAIRWVMENSDEVRNRMDTLDRDIRTELTRLNNITATSKTMQAVLDSKKFVFHGIGYMDRLVSVPTWIAGYNNALAAGMDEVDARYAGDKAVRQSQGAGGPKDLAAIQRGTGNMGEALKLFTMFYSYFSAQYQRQRTLARDITGDDTRRPRNMPKLAARAFFLLALPPMLVELLRGIVGAPSGPDDEEWWAQWLMRKLLANALGPIPFARDVFEPAWNGIVGNRVFNPSISPIQRAYDSVVKVGRDVGKLVEGDETKSATKDVLELVGYSTGLVPGQVASATQFLVDVSSGDADPQGFGDWVEGLSTGKLKD